MKVINKQILIQVSVWAATVAILLYVFRIPDQTIDAIELQLLLLLENLAFAEIKYLIPVFIHAIPFFIFIMLTGTFVREEILNKGVFIFTRVQNRSRWTFSILMQLLVFTICYVSVLFIALILILLVTKSSSSVQHFTSLGIIYTLYILFYFVIALFSNLLAVMLNSQLSYLITSFIYMFNIFVAGFFNQVLGDLTLLKWLPVSQGIITWHESTYFTSVFHRYTINDFTFSISYLYLVIIIILLFYCFLRKIDKMELY
ncbi:hypothetical protein [Caldalkalibacillus salinus]|uniref:hypothetical protein n=1 Tax=Caldalkalibacillus salinus TaxID=2803787 RepID=UPI0019212C0C|nr:hypothetical protein [Caldalkalibacillus salinus]